MLKSFSESVSCIPGSVWYKNDYYFRAFLPYIHLFKSKHFGIVIVDTLSTNVFYIKNDFQNDLGLLFVKNNFKKYSRFHSIDESSKIENYIPKCRYID